MARLLNIHRNALLLMLAITVAYAFTKWLVSAGLANDFLRYYFTDLLCIPLQLTVALTGARLLKRDATLLVPEVQIAVVVVGMSVLFEWYLPHYSANAMHYTADLSDVAMYILGGGIFSILQRTTLCRRM